MKPVKYTFPNLGIDVDVGLIHIDRLVAKVAVPPIAVHRVLGTASTIDGGREEERWQPPFRDAKGTLHIPVPLSSPNVGAVNDTGIKLLELKLFDKAIQYFERAAKLDPELAEPHYNRGNALTVLGRFDDALASYDATLALQPEYASAHNNRGFALEQLTRFEEAIASYDAVLAIQPEHVNARANRERATKKMSQSAQKGKV
jgi:tetratricopeptide (TPR) repeat protein